MRVHATKTVKDPGTHNEMVRYEHPCFGRITVSKSQGTPQVLFGSALKHQQSVVIELSRANFDRQLSRDWVNEGDLIARFIMSEAQWAQHVSSIGCGTGVPVTLEQAPALGTPTVAMPGLESGPLKENFEIEVRKAAREASEGVIKAQELIAEFMKPGAKPPSKKDLVELNGMLAAAGDRLEGSMGFIQKSFATAMENTVQSAKVEIESFAGNLAMRAGFDALKSSSTVTPMMIEGNSTTHEE